MDPEAQGRFESVEFRLTEAEEKIVSQDAVLSAIRKLTLTGTRLLTDTDEKLKALTDAQIANEDKLRRLLDRPPNGHS